MNIITHIKQKTRKKSIPFVLLSYITPAFLHNPPLSIESVSQLSTLGAFHRMSASAYQGASVALMLFCGKVRAFNVVRGEQC
jgi:hypothetical protein